MQALVAYIKWLGKGVATGKMANGSGLFKLAYLTRAADSAKGKLAYAKKCITCHGKNGEGAKKASQREYLYPPVWGNNSFTTAAGLYRISNFAKYIYANMPLGATFYEPQLTDEEAWDIAAYVVSMDRPVKTFPNDWPKVASKPIDYPFGPYADNLTERRHKYGPFQ
jgi:thiosulfate dehydrogenase